MVNLEKETQNGILNSVNVVKDGFIYMGKQIVQSFTTFGNIVKKDANYILNNILKLFNDMSDLFNNVILSTFKNLFVDLWNLIKKFIENIFGDITKGLYIISSSFCFILCSLLSLPILIKLLTK